MSSSALTFIADMHGGWAQLCDPARELTAEIYASFEQFGVSKETLDIIKATEQMPARQRILLDVSEDLLAIWARYLCGFTTGERSQFSGNFTSLPGAYFWSHKTELLKECGLTVEAIEDYIQSLLETDETEQGSGYVSLRECHITKLARLCSNYRPPDPSGPDLNPSLVPNGPNSPIRETAIALAIPAIDKESSGL